MENYNRIFLTDLHFGHKHNSMTWFRDQMDFMRYQLMPHIDALCKKRPTELYILGDLFDNRKTVDIYIGIEVKKFFFTLLKEHLNLSIYIIAGNHDYYDGKAENTEYNIYNLLFTSANNTSTLPLGHLRILDGVQCDNFGGDSYITTYAWPWFATNHKKWKDNIDYKGRETLILCHGTLPGNPGEPSLTDEDIEDAKHRNHYFISGHIHTPKMDWSRNCLTIGSCFPLTFADANQERYYYVLEAGQTIHELKAVPNTVCRKFWRFYSMEDFEKSKADRTRDFIELYINSKMFDSVEFVEQMKELCAANSNITVYNIPDERMDNIQTEIDMQFDMSKYLVDLIPEHLKAKYEIIEHESKEH